MYKRLKHILFSGMVLATLICIFSCSASAFSYSGSVNSVDLSTYTINIGGTTLPLEKYPDGSYSPYNNTASAYMTVEEAKDYGISLSNNLWLRGSECVGFARYVYAALYYKYPATAVMDNYLAYKINGSGSYAYIDLISSPMAGGSYSSADIERLFKSCYPGSVFRSGGHSMVIMSIFDDGMIIYDANFSYTDYNVVDVRKYTWESFYSRMGGRTIESVQIPAYYPGYSDSLGRRGGGAVEDEDLDKTKSGVYKVVNVNSYLNLRTGPSTAHSIYTSVAVGAELQVLGTYNGWAFVEYNDVQCWASLSYLEVVILSVSMDGYIVETDHAGPYEANSGLGYVNVRDLPSSTSTKLGTLTNGTIIQVIGTYDTSEETWAAFYYNGNESWASMEYLSLFSGKVTVTYDAAGGACDTTNKEYSIGEALGSLPTPTKADRVFLGWYSGNSRCSDSTVVDNDMTLTAKWGVKIFTDVEETAWFAPSVEYVYNQGVMTGTSNSSFEPLVNLTRASAAQILYNLAGKPAVAVSTNTFPDVKTSDWHFKAVEWAAMNGLVNGDENGYFMPDDYITRQDFVVVLWRYAKNYAKQDPQPVADLTKFPDHATVADYATEAMKWAVGKGLINGMGDGTLSPKETATRSMIAKIMNMYLQ